MIDEQKEAKQRIFDAAVHLFALKGFHAVGVREIALAAKVNISMINYYFGGKVGILKEIINVTWLKYRKAMVDAGNDSTPLRERLGGIVRNFIKFFRENTELSMVALSPLPYDIPEIVDLKEKLSYGNFEAMKGFFKQLGVDLCNNAQMSVLGSLIGNTILQYFQNCYIWEHHIKTTEEHKKERLDMTCCKDDEFYETYAQTITKFYLSGVQSIISKNQKKEEEEKCPQ